MAQAAKIPIIDLSGDEAQVAHDLVEAAIEHGFIYIRNTGKDIPVEAIDDAFNLARKLFALPVEEKQTCLIQKNNRGWSSMQYETLDPKNQRVGDFKEAFNLGEFQNAKAQQPLPPSLPPTAEPLLSALHDKCHALCLKLCHLLGLGLAAQPPSFFAGAHDRSAGPSGTILRLLHYPPLSSVPSATPHLDVRAGAHSDYGSMTLLFRIAGQAGLEIQTTSQDGGSKWAPVPVVPPGTEGDPAPPILLNIGDLLSYWTGGLLRSTVHHVVFPGGRGTEATVVEGETDSGPRYSIAYFCHPVGSMPLTPVPSERVRRFIAEHPAEGDDNGGKDGKVVTADEHLHMRLRASYLQMYPEKE
ncbi:putative gibberellin 20 oxidase [Echria macrotheca]|uniref:Gibberellin 20 oxidase n=1 Tax=Echria macrotheca TaxID=438768 RepID=A0AAJ0BMF8_9PEZI|nr:putative gibberellin 20 oxidase [Echria macrotheca]